MFKHHQSSQLFFLSASLPLNEQDVQPQLWDLYVRNVCVYQCELSSLKHLDKHLCTVFMCLWHQHFVSVLRHREEAKERIIRYVINQTDSVFLTLVKNWPLNFYFKMSHLFVYLKLIFAMVLYILTVYFNTYVSL